MALEVVTDGNNDKTETNDQEYVHNKRTRDGTWTCVLFCVLPSFVLTDNECIPSYAVIWGESNEELRMKQHVVFIFHSLFQEYAIKAEIYLELLPFIFGGPK